MPDFIQQIEPILKTGLTDIADLGKIVGPIVSIFNPAIGGVIKGVSSLVLGSQTGAVSDSEAEAIIQIADMVYQAVSGKPPDPQKTATLRAALQGHGAQFAAYLSSGSVVLEAFQAAYPRVAAP